MLSTVQDHDAIEKKTEKTEIVMLYNHTKGGVHIINELCSKYNCARNSQRSPLEGSYSSSNVARSNYFLIYSSNNSPLKIRRRKFLKPHKNLYNPICNRSLGPWNYRKICDIQENQDENTTQSLSEKHKCYNSDKKRNRNIRYLCRIRKTFAWNKLSLYVDLIFCNTRRITFSFQG